jgi:cyclopropane-fatty-acyl-phospholipid synthase
MTTATLQKESDYGGSAEAIRYHYDVGRAFYALWLDETMSYSSALWESPTTTEPLAAAQHRKIAHHLENARASRARRLLDIGCGWGGLMRAAAQLPNVEQIVGLTLSEDQAACVREIGNPKFEVRLENWVDHRPAAPYDSIVSIGAFEHFAKPSDTIEEKIKVYRDFFSACRSWLAPEGRMSLQTIAYGTMKREEASQFINQEIFPDADLPTLAEICTAAEGVMEITAVVNHRLHYARTFETWAANLKKNHAQAVKLVGEETTVRYERYLTQSSTGFYMGKIGLLRLALRPIGSSWRQMAAP